MICPRKWWPKSGDIRAQAQDSGKPPEIVEKMIDGRIRNFWQRIALTEQAFVKDPDLTVASSWRTRARKSWLYPL